MKILLLVISMVYASTLDTKAFVQTIDIITLKIDSAKVQFVNLTDSNLTNFIKKWITILEEKEPYFKERGVLVLRFNRYYSASNDTLGFYSLNMLYGYVGENSSEINPIYYANINSRYILIEADPIFTKSLSISKKSLSKMFKKMEKWFLYPHQFIDSNNNKTVSDKKEIIGNRVGDAGALNIVLWEYTPALIIRRNLPPVSTGRSVYGWSK